jgi:hypothetical protein
VVRGAGTARRVHKIRPASLDEIAVITQEMPEQYRVMVLLAAWCALRFGELTELQRRDIVIVEPTEEAFFTALNNSEEPPESYGVVRVERAVVRTVDGFQVTTPESAVLGDNYRWVPLDGYPTRSGSIGVSRQRKHCTGGGLIWSRSSPPQALRARCSAC